MATRIVLAGIVVVVTGLVVVVTQWAARRSNRFLWGLAAPALVGYAALLMLQPPPWPLSTAMVFAAGLVFGVAIGAQLASAPSLAVFMVTAAAADLLSFFSSGGLTARIVDSYRSGHSLLLLYLSVAVPVGGRLVPIVGIGDIVILSAALHSLARLGTSAGARLSIGLSGLLGAMVVGLMMGGVAAVPFLAVAVVAYLLMRRPGATGPTSSTPGSGA